MDLRNDTPATHQWRQSRFSNLDLSFGRLFVVMLASIACRFVGRVVVTVVINVKYIWSWAGCARDKVFKKWPK